MVKKNLHKVALTLALMGLAVFGVRTLSAHAMANTQPVAQVQSCADNQANDATEAKDTGADTDTVDLQCGDQNAPDGDQVAATGPDTDTVQAGDQTTVDSVKDGAEDPSTGPDTDNAQDGPGSQVEDGKPDAPGADGETAGK